MPVKLRAVLLAVLLAGCAGGGNLPMSTPDFVTVMVELRRAAAAGGDFASRRAEILARAGTSEAELREYVRQAARRPKELSAAFDSITARLLVATQVQ